MSKNPLSFFWADWRRHLPYRRYGELEDRSRRLAAMACSLITVFAGAVYLIWLAGVVFHNPGFQNLLFLAAEIMAFLLLAFLAHDIWHLRHHRPEGLKAKRPWSVDIFVPCCGEPREIICTTLKAVSQIVYQPVTVYVLDDAGVEEVAALAQVYGFHYLSRPRAGVPRKDAKAGNLNFGLSQSQGELILVLDADQVPAPDILSRLAGFFDLPRVAFVQTKQSFYLPEGDPFYNRDEIFYETVQSSNDQANAVISCGSGVVYLRQALAELGGFATWNIVEDLTTSYEILSRGWKGVYFPYALSQGLAPMGLAGVYRQRFQWCLDAMRLFFWDNPLAKRGLNRTQRFHFLLFMVSYLVSGLVFPAFYLLPLLGYWRGYSCFPGQELDYLALREGYLLATICMFRYLFLGKDALKQFKMLCGLFPVYAAAIFAALIYPPGRKPAYRLNSERLWGTSINWPFLLPHLGFILLNFTLPFLSLKLGWAPPQLIMFNALFSAFTIWVLTDLVMVGLCKPRWGTAMDPREVYGY